MSDAPTALHPAKQAAIEQWTADPCGWVEGEPGSGEYFSRLLEMRREYAPWMHDVLGYDACVGMDVLDVGSGQGIDLANYARGGARAVGIDLTPRHVELAQMHLQAHGLDAEIHEGDAEALPFRDETFNRVSSNGVLHHTPNIDAALREIYRVLRPGGEARIILYHRDSLHYWTNQVLFHGIIKRRLISERSMSKILSSNVERSSVEARPLVRVYSRRQVRNMLRAAGFDDVRAPVRHFQRTDSFVYDLIGARVPRLFEPSTLDRVGRRAGWYVIGVGRKPSRAGAQGRN